MRGLKRLDIVEQAEVVKVAPLVGAWIETVINARGMNIVKVAPLVGAWIETPYSQSKPDLKSVAPLVGAWIETSPNSDSTLVAPSHLS